MQIIENTTEFHIEEKTAIAIGKFDGLHRGHREIFSVLEKAKAQGLKTAIFTFDPSPATFFCKSLVQELSTRSEKRRLFEKIGVDYLVEYPFRQETADVLPKDYVTDFLLNKMNGKLIVAGEDVTFGKGGKGDAKLLEEMASEYDFELKIISKIKYHGEEISSTFVRNEVREGRMEVANELLGEPYFVCGIVENGKKLGRTLGMPTANLYPEEEKLLPPFGVYFCDVLVEGNRYHGVTNIGSRPTVSDGNRVSVETYLLDFDGDLYGKEMIVYLLHFRRPEQKFHSVEELKNMVLRNIDEARDYFS